MIELTDRQRQLLKAIVEEYIDSAEPIGSEVLDKKHNLGVSPATIRIEMVRLTDAGFLKQPHTSAGRIPTSMGLRFYVNELMNEKQLSVTAEISIKEKLWQDRFKKEKLLKEAVLALAQRSNMLGLAIDEDSQLYYAGTSNILDWPEFYDIDVTRFVLSLFDECPKLQEIFGLAQGSDPIHILFGEDMDFEYLKPTSFVFTRYETSPDHGGVLGVVGPARMNFPMVLPYLRYISGLLTQAYKV